MALTINQVKAAGCVHWIDYNKAYAIVGIDSPMVCCPRSLRLF
jgi:hypothetical protein